VKDKNALLGKGKIIKDWEYAYPYGM
jgi:hypothetical protein